MQRETASLSCEHCGETFQRREHRDRHVLRHTGLKPFHCHVCSRSFSRNDTLQRHRSLHTGRGDAPRSPGRRAARACQPCARLKQRCDGKSPCARCIVRNASCHYNHTRESVSLLNAADADDVEDHDPVDDATQRPATQTCLPDDGADLHSRPQPTVVHHDGLLPMDVQTMNGQWGEHASLGHVPAVSPGDISRSSLEDAASWRQDSIFAATGLYHGNSGGYMSLLDDPWVPWNNMAINSALPWSFDDSWGRLDESRPLDLQYDAHSSSHVPADVPLTQRVDPASSGTGASLSHGVHTEPSRAPVESQDADPHVPRPCRPFPRLQNSSLEVAGAEIYGHVPQLSKSAMEGFHSFYRTQTRDAAAPLLHERILHVFVELYYEHFNVQFPFLHPIRMEASETPWVLLLAVAAVGSHYSEVPDAQLHHLVLVDLLGRAIEPLVSRNLLRPDIAIVQSVFLLHVLWMFSGSHKDKVVLQHKRSMLVSLCWDLLSNLDPDSKATDDHNNVEGEWQAWLCGEEQSRVVTCVRVLDCIGFLFLDIPTIFRLSDSSRQLPAPEHLWRCKDARSWKSAHRSLPTERRRARYQGDWPGKLLESEMFAAKVALIELFVDERTMARQMRASRLVRASVSSFLDDPAKKAGRSKVSSHMPGVDPHRDEDVLLDSSLDLLSYATLESAVSSPNGHTETIFHALKILRHAPLEILHTATGWKTNKETMHKSKTMFREFCQRDPVQARMCLWHASRIFKVTRTSRKLACYDIFSIMVSMSYIYCFSSLCISGSTSDQASTAQADAAVNSKSAVVVRLDQLNDRSQIERWAKDDKTDYVVHLTGVGLLDGSDDCVRFLRDVERALKSQVAWRGFCCAFAASFAQLRRGEMPTPGQEKDDEGSGS